MSNNYFQFKQFTIHQDQCAMKVCTDACLFGALVANEIQLDNTKHILDIGTGTGLLSLMLAQKNNATINAVEIDSAAFEQATANIALTPWKDNISIYNTDITTFYPDKKYDFIISNPPFFETDLKSNDAKKNAAKHDTTLTLTDLIENINRLLNHDGYFAVLIPFHRCEYFETAASTFGFHLAKKIAVKQTPKHNYFRAVLFFSKQSADQKEIAMQIKNEAGNYSEAFIALLKDYYLHL